MSITLTADQNDILNKLIEWSYSEDPDPILVLKGSAGTGKTTLLEHYLNIIKKRVMMTAPTHKAVGVMKKIMPKATCKTIHSALSLKPKRVNHEWVNVQNFAKKTKNMQGFDVVVVDEGSMVDDDILSHIINDIEISNRIYLIVGDDAQLKSVKDGTSPVFEIDNPLELYTIVRQAAESPIIQIATQFRNKILFGDNLGELKYSTNDHGSVVKNSRSEFKVNIAKNFNIETDVLVGWTNKNARYYNSFINKEINNIDNGDMVVGQRVVFNEAYIEDDEVVVSNGHEDIITSIMPGYSDKLGLEYIIVRLEDEGGRFRVIQDKHRDAYEEKLKYYHTRAKSDGSYWKDYYSLLEMFADIRLPYSITTHKSQGSTFRQVFLDMGNIKKNRYDRDAVLRMCYVGLTRASHSVVTCG